MAEKKRKIGILTYHNSVNNGAVMQAYSLSKRLQQENPQCEVEIIDYHMPKVNAAYHHSLWEKITSAGSVVIAMKRLARAVLDMDYNRKMNSRAKVFADCRHLLPLSAFSLLSDETEELFDYINREYDVLVVGSDAIWNHILRGFPNAYLPDRTVTVTKMSYAASCYGMDFLTCPEDVRTKIGHALQDFAFLGVRDTATEQYVQWSGCDKLPVHVCDPTVFLDVNDLPMDVAVLEDKLRKRGFDFDRPTIGMMGNEKMLRMLRKLYGNKYQIAALYVPVKGADVNLYDLTPYEWAYVFRYFKLTFTTYFHGTLLSLRNGVPVICISLKTEFGKKHTPKTLDVLTRLGYASWYFETDYAVQNVEAICQKADALLAADLKEEIIARMDQEAESFMAFQAALSEKLREKEI